MTHHPATPPAADTLTVDQHEAARLTGLSAKTLDRRAAAGEPVGRIKTGHRVLYVRAALQAWLASKLAAPTPR